MEKALQVKIVSPEKVIYNGPAQCVQVPGEKGSFEVLYNHAPIISSLSEGTVKCMAKETVEIDIVGGFVDVNANNVSICVEPQISEE